MMALPTAFHQAYLDSGILSFRMLSVDLLSKWLQV